jgi:hypothetical protein
MASAESAKASIWRDRRQMDAQGTKSDAIPAIEREAEGEETQATARMEVGAATRAEASGRRHVQRQADDGACGGYWARFYFLSLLSSFFFFFSFLMLTAAKKICINVFIIVNY